MARFTQILDASDVAEVTIMFDGTPRNVAAGASVAASLLGKGDLTVRTHPVTKSRRAPYCLMGVCFECLMEVDGLQQRACMVRVRGGMEIKSQ